MKKIIYTLLGIIWSTTIIAQTNLVLNEGFEKGLGNSSRIKEMRTAGYLTVDWYNPLHKRSPHLFKSPERSLAKAHSGSVALGLVLGAGKKEKNKTEYITGKLKTPLVKGQAYCVRFHILLHRSSKWAASNVGVRLHQNRNLIAEEKDLEALEANLYANGGEPVINTKWQAYNGYYVASGGEQFISLGSFGKGKSIEIKALGLKPYFQLDAFQTKAFYQLDDIAVIAHNDSLDCGCAEPPKIENDTTSEKNKLTPYLFALDASGSMREDGVFDSLRHNLADLLKRLPLGTPVTFSTFSVNSSLVYSGKLDRNTPRLVDSLLSKLKLGGGTSVNTGLDMAAKSWQSQGPDSARIILISDGVFNVNNKIERIVKNEFENKGRRLIVVQIKGVAQGTERLAPYQTSFIHVSPSELKQAISQIYKSYESVAIACECVDEYTDTMNYHFIIDYSGSMSKHKDRAIKTLRKLYEQAPATAVISITAFSTRATELYVGRKADMSLSQLDALLNAHVVKGGTDPTPGVEHGLGVAQKMSDKRFSHLIIITDLKTTKLNEMPKMKMDIQQMSDKIDLAVSSVTVDLSTQMDILVSGRAQFDMTSSIFREVSVAKFEKDLFDTRRSGCDYTTQPYHYNPAEDVAKEVAKKSLRLFWKELMKNGVSIGR